MSNPETPVLAVRGSTGIFLTRGPPFYDLVSSFPSVTSKKCRTMIFSPNGQYFAWFDGLKIMVVSVSTWTKIFDVEKPRTSCLSFSPNGTYLNAWEPFLVSPENPKGTANLFIWKITTGELMQSFVQKKQMNWEPQYSKDEKICSRCVDGQVLFYEEENFETAVHKISTPKIESFSMSPGLPYHVLCYMPGSSGPSFGKLFKYPQFDSCVANKTFFKADRVDMYWNNKGNHVLLLTSTEMDKTNATYYGKQSLHFLSTKSDTAIVLLNKEGPIHSVSWSPLGDEFCVVYGFMPAKAALFDHKCEMVYDFGNGPRNSIYFNPHGNLLILAGFGNINGSVEMWDVPNKRRIKQRTISDTTFLQWSPDGMHFVTATTAPRLRVDNGFKIFHYSGSLLYERPWNKQEELWEVKWQTFPENKFKKPTISPKPVEGIQSSESSASKEVYRPPAARGLASCVKFSVHEETDSNESRHLSKQTLKMKKKRESKRQAKLQQKQEQQLNNANADSNSSSTSTSRVNNSHTSNNESNNAKSKGDANLSDKTGKIKKIKTTLKGIEKLKELKANGSKLDTNQLTKISREADLLKELESLQL